MKPEFNEENDAMFIAMLAPLADGPRVRILEAHCANCGEVEWLSGIEGTTCTVAAAILRQIAQQWHTDDCPGPVLFATEPAEASA